MTCPLLHEGSHNKWCFANAYICDCCITSYAMLYLLGGWICGKIWQWRCQRWQWCDSEYSVQSVE